MDEVKTIHAMFGERVLDHSQDYLAEPISGYLLSEEMRSAGVKAQLMGVGLDHLASVSYMCIHVSESSSFQPDQVPSLTSLSCFSSRRIFRL